jgi:hypothetical protein
MMTNGTSRIPLLLLLALLLAASTSCSLTKGKGIAEAAVVQFHNQFNAGQFHEIYAQTDEGFKKGTNEADLVELFEAVHRKLGTVNQANPAGWGVNTTPSGTMATLSYEVEFSEGKGQEEFVFHIEGNKALLYHYNINSPLLITR